MTFLNYRGELWPGEDKGLPYLCISVPLSSATKLKRQDPEEEPEEDPLGF